MKFKKKRFFLVGVSKKLYICGIKPINQEDLCSQLEI